MTVIDETTVRKVARLARIRLNESQVGELINNFSTIMPFVNQLNEVNTKDVQPMQGVAYQAAPMREDAVTDGNYADDLLKNAPEEMQHFFVVPKVVE